MSRLGVWGPVGVVAGLGVVALSGWGFWVAYQSSLWVEAPSEFTEWETIGVVHNCGPWAPSAGDVYHRDTITQSRTCHREQARTETVLERNTQTEQIRVVREQIDERYGPVPETRSRSGQRRQR